MNSATHQGEIHEGVSVLSPTLTKQCWLFMVGSALFAVGPAVTIWDFGTATLANLLCFVGAWFFTAAGLIQTARSGPMMVTMKSQDEQIFRAEWLAGSVQSVGTVLFNVSTTAALTARTVAGEKHLVWNPDAGGSVAFLISAVFVYVYFWHQHHSLLRPRNSSWWAAHINMMGCIAFAVSAVGAFVLDNGNTADSSLANWATLVGAICFFVASAIALPKLPWNQTTKGSKELAV